MTDTFQAYLDRQLAALAPEQLRAYLNFLRGWLPEDIRRLVAALHFVHGAEWPSRQRFEQEEGQRVMNALRAAGYPDSELPAGSWDVYYQRLLEIACGLREDPLSAQPGANAA